MYCPEELYKSLHKDMPVQLAEQYHRVMYPTLKSVLSLIEAGYV